MEWNECECGTAPVRMPNGNAVCGCTPASSSCLSCLWWGRVDTFDTPASHQMLATAIITRALDDAIGNFQFRKSPHPEVNVYKRGLIALDALLWLTDPSKQRDFWFSVVECKPPTPLTIIPILLAWRNVRLYMSKMGPVSAWRQPKRDDNGDWVEADYRTSPILTDLRSHRSDVGSRADIILGAEVYGQVPVETAKGGIASQRARAAKGGYTRPHRLKGWRAKRKTRDVTLEMQAPVWQVGKRKGAKRVKAVETTIKLETVVT